MLEHLFLAEIRGVTKDNRLKELRRQPEVPTGQRWKTLNINKDANCKRLKHTKSMSL